MKKVKLIIGIMLLPIAYALFVGDRLIMGLFMPHYAHPTFLLWCNVKYSTLALLRFMLIGIIYTIIMLII